jgi:hypothetical protein
MVKPDADFFLETQIGWSMSFRLSLRSCSVMRGGESHVGFAGSPH